MSIRGIKIQEIDLNSVKELCREVYGGFDINPLLKAKQFHEKQLSIISRMLSGIHVPERRKKIAWQTDWRNRRFFRLLNQAPHSWVFYLWNDD